MPSHGLSEALLQREEMKPTAEGTELAEIPCFSLCVLRGLYGGKVDHLKENPLCADP